MKKDFIHSHQLGFRKKHSTTDALIHLSDKIRNEPDKSNYSCGIFEDFGKPFDTVDHHILLKKSEYYGVRGTLNKWFASENNKK